LFGSGDEFDDVREGGIVWRMLERLKGKDNKKNLWGKPLLETAGQVKYEDEVG
jgi:hypothetical protein